MKKITHRLSPTMKEVAAQAGVSTATVSRVFTTPDKVSARTRQRVEIAAQTLGYALTLPPFPKENPYCYKVLVIIAEMTDSFYGEIIRGIETQAYSQQCLLTFFDYACHATKPSLEYLLQMIGGYDGRLFVGLSPPTPNENDFTPSVVINDYASTHALPTIHIDNLSASFHAVSYLIERGHQHIACLSGPEELSLCQYRRQGYLQALQRNNIPPNPYYFIRGDFSFTSGMSATDYLLQLATPPDALFCHNDKMALGAMYRAKQLGVAIPKQLSVIGFEGGENGHWADPPLSVISQPRRAQGQAAMTLLMDLMKGKPVTHRSYLLETQLLLRQSTR